MATDKDYEQLQRDHEALKAQHTQWLSDFEKHEPLPRDAYSGYIQGRIDERNAKSLSPVDLVENAADLITLERAIEAAREEHKALRDFVSDLVENGVRFDMNPTHNMSTLDTIENFWHSYIRRIDESIKRRAQHALGNYTEETDDGDEN